MIKRIASGATIQNVEGPDDLAALEASVLTSFRRQNRDRHRCVARHRPRDRRAARGGRRDGGVRRRAATTRMPPRRRSRRRAARPKRVGADVTDAAAVEASIKSVVEKHGKLDILVSNAGITRDQLMLRMKRSDWDEVDRHEPDGVVHAVPGGAEADDSRSDRAASSRSARWSDRWATPARPTTRRRRRA